MTEKTRQLLKNLADKYETPSFMENDPSQFLRWYSMNRGDSLADIECSAFIAAMLSFGSRTQFIPKIRYILELADKTSGSFFKWIVDGAPDFPEGDNKFYRFYSFNDLRNVFAEMVTWDNGDSPCCIFDKIRQLYFSNTDIDIADIISVSFSKSKIVPKGKNSAKKRIYMFLRWMVRQNSPVDIGIWDWYSAEKLLIPLDVHVIQMSKTLELLDDSFKATKKTAIMLTEELKEVFPNDPCKGDFALFGLGVDSSMHI